MTAGGKRKPRYGFGDIVMLTACHGPAEAANLTVPSSTISERCAISALARSISISSARTKKRSSPQCAPSANGCWRGSDRKVTGPIERHTLQPIPTFRRSGCAHSARVSAVLADAGAVAQGPEYRRHGFPHWAAGRTVGAARRHDAYAGADLLILLPSALAARARTEHPWFRRHRTHSQTLLGTVDPAIDANRQGSLDRMRDHGTRLISACLNTRTSRSRCPTVEPAFMFVKMALEI